MGPINSDRNFHIYTQCIIFLVAVKHCCLEYSILFSIARALTTEICYQLTNQLRQECAKFSAKVYLESTAMNRYIYTCFDARDIGFRIRQTSHWHVVHPSSMTVTSRCQLLVMLTKRSLTLSVLAQSWYFYKKLLISNWISNYWCGGSLESMLEFPESSPRSTIHCIISISLFLTSIMIAKSVRWKPTDSWK